MATKRNPSAGRPEALQPAAPKARPDGTNGCIAWWYCRIKTGDTKHRSCRLVVRFFSAFLARLSDNYCRLAAISDIGMSLQWEPELGLNLFQSLESHALRPRPFFTQALALVGLVFLVVAVEIEAPEVGARRHHELADGDVVQPARHVLPDGLVAFERLAALLNEGHLDRRADLDRAAVGLLLARDHAEQRRLARAVRPDDADDRAGRHLEAQVVDQHPVAEPLGDVLELDHLVAQALGHGNEDFVRLVALLVFDIRQLLE